MQYHLNELKNTINESYEFLFKISKEESEIPIAKGKWSKKEILGHLIDSVSNNHQRIVRTLLVTNLNFPAYEQDKWVKIQHYQGEDWLILIDLWKNYNLHLLHLISIIPEESLNKLCRIGDKEPISLLFLIEDYLNHLKHHLGQIIY
jgi:hypothetical protein